MAKNLIIYYSRREKIMSMGELKVYRKAIQKFVRNTSGNLSVETFLKFRQ